MIVLGPCGKRTYPSIHAMRLAFRRAGFRIRGYWCDDCRGYHAANHEKR